MVVATSTRKSPTKGTKKDGKTMKKDCKGNAPSRVDKALVNKAVSALVKYHNSQASKKEDERSTMSLLGNDRSVQVQFGLEVPPTDTSFKPVRVMIPNPILQVAGGDDNEGLEEPDVCLIVKEESKARVKEMIEEFQEHMGCVKKVLGLDSLRKKHSRFQQRRELLQKYDVFMADDRILPMLTSALGKDFVKAKKLPIPINISRKEALPFAIQNSLSATYMTVSRGTSITVKAGNTGMNEKKLVQNIVAIAENAVEKIPRKWANIRSISIKTPESTSLPFYHKLPEELLEIAKLAGVAPAFKDIPESQDNKTAEKSEDESPSKKRELVGKSPLIRALKKQKKDGSEKDAKDKSEKPPAAKGGQKDKTPRENKKRVMDETESKEKPPSKTEEKKRRKESKADDGDKQKETGDFVASKKFKGSKKGYVFRAGKEGVGYYKDVKPVVDKMILAALSRSFNQGGSKGRKSKSPGKRRGRR